MFPIDAIGHVNPLLAIISELTDLPGDPSDKPDVCGFGPVGLEPVFRAAGASYRPIGDGSNSSVSPYPTRTGGEETDSSLSDLAAKSFLAPQAGLASMLKLVKNFRPDIILYDIFCLSGALASRVLRVPGVSLLTFAGFGVLRDDFVQEHSSRAPAIRRANDRMIKDFGVDILGHATALPTLFPSPDLSIVTATRSQCPSLDPVESPRLSAIVAPAVDALRFVGPCVGRVRWGSTEGMSDDDFPFELLDRANASGATIVLCSMGTNISSFRRRLPVGGAPSGSAFLHTIFNLVRNAFKADPTYVAVISTGGWGELRYWPPNFIVRDFVPQRRLLAEYADVFVTHNGLNSTVEGILSSVPMVAFPGYGDQVFNAQFCVDAGVAVAPWSLEDPVSTCTVSSLRRAVRLAALDPGLTRRFDRLRDEFSEAGGATGAALLILKLVS